MARGPRRRTGFGVRRSGLHADTIHVAVVTDRGGHVADAEFPTTAAGCAAAIAFLNAHGTVAAVGVEGTSSYGLGFTRAPRPAGLTVIEVNRPDKGERRRIGKSDPIGFAHEMAYAAGVWVDDEIGDANRAWVAARQPGDALLRRVDARVGLAVDDYLAVAAWLRDRTGG